MSRPVVCFVCDGWIADRLIIADQRDCEAIGGDLKVGDRLPLCIECGALYDVLHTPPRDPLQVAFDNGVQRYQRRQLS